MASLPNPVVGGAISTANVVDQVLNKGDLDGAPDQVDASGDHLGQREQVERRGVKLEMAPLVISHDWPSRGCLILGMQSIQGILCMFKSFNFFSLAHHRSQQPAH